MLNDTAVAVEFDASIAFSGAGDLLPLGSDSSAVDLGEGHVREGHGARSELRAISDGIGFQGGVDAGEDFSCSRAAERRTVASDARIDGEIGTGVAAVGLNGSMNN